MHPDVDTPTSMIDEPDTSPVSGSSLVATDGPRVRGWTIGLAAGIVVVMAAVFAVAIMLATRESTPSSTATAGADVTYYVPARTGERIDAGEEVEIIPDQISIRVADTLVLINDDDRTHNLGGYNVRAGDTLRINYPRPGLYMNSCSVNPGGLVYVNVVA